MTIAEIAAEVDLSKTTVRLWLGRYDLKTRNKVGPRIGEETKLAKEAGRAEMVTECLRHGATTYVMEGRGYYRCQRRRSEHIAQHRRRLKEMLVAEAGGSCRLCGYDRFLGALQFHHLDPSAKRLGISANGLTLSVEAVRQEAMKCVLLCSNCHAEVEGGVRQVVVE
jgi:5-methylcytosine-specific restriction endonuclease McrA